MDGQRRSSTRSCTWVSMSLRSPTSSASAARRCSTHSRARRRDRRCCIYSIGGSSAPRSCLSTAAPSACPRSPERAVFATSSTSCAHSRRRPGLRSRTGARQSPEAGGSNDATGQPSTRPNSAFAKPGLNPVNSLRDDEGRIRVHNASRYHLINGVALMMPIWRYPWRRFAWPKWSQDHSTPSPSPSSTPAAWPAWCPPTTSPRSRTNCCCTDAAGRRTSQL